MDQQCFDMMLERDVPAVAAPPGIVNHSAAYRLVYGSGHRPHCGSGFRSAIIEQHNNAILTKPTRAQFDCDL